MTDDQFNVLDELYFVRSFGDLKSSLDLTEDEIVLTLKELYKKGWVKVLRTVDDEVMGKVDWEKYSGFYFLASKSGLMAHNTTE